MKRLLLLLVLISILLSRSLPVGAAPRALHVFIVSFDGGKPEVMERSPMPNYFQMESEGAATWKAQTVFPSLTLVAHTSMLTGVVPAKHHVLWNDWIPEKGVVKVPTAFSLAHEKGYFTAMFAGKPKFRHLAVPDTLDEFQVLDTGAKSVAAVAAQYIIGQKPNLCFIHFADSDNAGHQFGWGTPEQVASFQAEDDALKILRDAVKEAGIEKNSVFILTADHGGHDRGHGTNSPADMTIPWLVWGASVRPGFQISTSVNTTDTAATALWLLDVPIPKNFDGKPVKSAFLPLPVKPVKAAPKP